MDKFVIKGGQRLAGTVRISGSKNAALPILASSLLADGRCVIKGVPYLRDVDTLLQILGELGVKSRRRTDGAIETAVVDERPYVARYELVKTMRASICVLGPLLAKRRRARVSQPGGCVIGVRPIDLHEKGLKLLGTKFKYEHGYLIGDGRKLAGAEIYLGGSCGSTVTGTANVLMAAVLAKGKTVIECAACEPEVQNLAHFLVKMGARIDGIGTPHLVIHGVKSLKGTTHTIIPDRIETGTFILAGAMTKGKLIIENCRVEHISALIDKLSEIGVKVKKLSPNRCMVLPARAIRPADVATLPYPGFPTDLQAQLMALLSLADGISVITEKIYPDRFMHIAELNRMGANIRKDGPMAVVQGVKRLYGAPVMASDLRASAALVLAGLAASGTTEVQRVYHIDRGYERIETKLQHLGAHIKRMPDTESSESKSSE